MLLPLLPQSTPCLTIRIYLHLPHLSLSRRATSTHCERNRFFSTLVPLAIILGPCVSSVYPSRRPAACPLAVQLRVAQQTAVMAAVVRSQPMPLHVVPDFLCHKTSYQLHCGILFSCASPTHNPFHGNHPFCLNRPRRTFLPTVHPVAHICIAGIRSPLPWSHRAQPSPDRTIATPRLAHRRAEEPCRAHHHSCPNHRRPGHVSR